MAKALNVSLQVSADTGQAKQALQSLQQQLTQLTTTPANITIGGDIKKEAVEASKAIAQLQVSLKNSTNSLTGNLNLTKFNQEMQQSGMQLKDYQNALNKMGPAGQQAFAKLASSIAQAEVPLRRTSGLFTELWTTMKNTARWQISSSILHGFMGAIQGAYRYTQDLNKSLTDIQIVTQASDEHMAQFAKTANTAAKQLSTTTNSYAKASLIYYQQGLGDKEVKERTDATIKMANVTGQTAQQVSDQMTAIWNNFDDGSHSLEYYADVITALGAATASSSEEISKGLEKFAAIADTVGLSYENATAALATITATTRQSADTVGTGLRTLFSRLQSLKLGETLEDGVDLTKYSKALKTIGVDVLDATGNLRDMDDILEDMGAQWDKLNNAQKTAVAQTVGGVRQYTTLMALMENFDFYKQNQQIAENSEGTLQKQQAIYEKSWQAASKRLRASAESIYSDLLDDKFFIKLTNGFSKFLDLIHNTISGLGGLKGVLFGIGTLMTTVFADRTTERLRNMIYDLKMLTPKGRAEVQGLQQQGAQMLATSVYSGTDQYSQTMSVAYSQQGQLQAAYLANAEKMSAAQQQVAQSLMQQQAALIQNVELQAQAVEKAQQEADLQERTSKLALRDLYNVSNLGKLDKNDIYSDLKFRIDKAANLSTYQGQADSFITGLNALKNAQQGFNLDNIKQQLQNFPNLFEGFSATSFEAGNKFKDFVKAVNSNDLIKVKDTFNNLWDAFKAPMGHNALDNLRSTIHRLAQDLGGEDTEAVKKFEQELEKLFSEKYKSGQLDFGLKEQTQGLTTYTQQLKQAMEELSNKPITALDGFVAMAGTLSSIGMMISQINGLIDVWNNKDLSFGKKLTTTLIQLGMIGSSISRIFSADTIAKMTTFNQQVLLGGGTKGAATAATSGVAAGAEMAEAAATKAAAAALKEKIIAAKLAKGATQEEATAAGEAAAAEMLQASGATAAAGGTAAAGASAAGASSGFWALAASIWAAYWPLLALAAIVGIVALVANAIETPAEKLERLNEEADNAAEAANNAKDAYKKLIELKTSRNEALNTLKQLTKGTLEYRDALIQANAISQDLIDIAGLKYGIDWWYDEDHVLQIKDSSYEAALERGLIYQENTGKAKFMADALVEGQSEQGYTYTNLYNEESRLQNTPGTYSEKFFNADGSMNNHEFSNSKFNGEKAYILTQYGGMTDAYGQWLAAGNTGSITDMHKSLINKSQSGQELTDQEKEWYTTLNGFDSTLASIFEDQGLYFSWDATNGNNVDAYMAKLTEMLAEEGYLEAGTTYDQVVRGMARERSGLYGGAFDAGIIEDNGQIRQALAYMAAEDGETTIIDNAIIRSLTEKYSDNDVLQTLEAAAEDQLATGLQGLQEQYKTLYGTSVIPDDIKDDEAKLRAANKEMLMWNSLYEEFTAEGIRFANVELDKYKNFKKENYGDLINLINEGYSATGENADVYHAMADAMVEQMGLAYGELHQALGLSAGEEDQLLDFVKNNNLSIDEMSSLTKYLNNFSDLFGTSIRDNVLNALVGEHGFNTELSNILNNIDFSSTLSGLFDLKKAANKYDINKGIGKQLNDLYNESLASIGGEAGLLEELYKSEEFKDSLEDLQKVYDQTGKIAASDILSAAKSNKLLNTYLEETNMQASTLAEILTMVGENGSLSIDQISNALIAAINAATSLENGLATTFQFIDDFSLSRSAQDIGDFYKGLVDTFEKGIRQGNVGDKQIYEAYAQLFGKQAAADLRQDFIRYSELAPGDRNAAFQADHAAEIAAMQSVKERGDLSGLWGYYQNKGAFADSGVTWDSATYDLAANGDNTNGWSNFQNDQRRQIKTSDDYRAYVADELKKANGGQEVDPQLVESLIQDQLRENVALQDYLLGNDAQAGLQELLSSSLEQGLLNEQELAAFYEQYGQYLKDENGNLLSLQDITKQFNQNGVKILKDSADYLDEKGRGSWEGFRQQVKDSGMTTSEYFDQMGAGTTTLSGEVQLRSGKAGSSKSQTVNLDEHSDWNKDFRDLDAYVEAVQKAGYSYQDAMTIAEESGAAFSRTVTNAFGETATYVQAAGESVEDFNNRVNAGINTSNIEAEAAIYADAFKSAFTDVDMTVDASAAQEAFDSLPDSVDVNVTATTTEADAKIKALAQTITVRADAYIVEHYQGGYYGGIVPSYASGSKNRKLKPGLALTGEEKPEIVWNPDLGYAYIVGQNGPEFTTLQPGDRVFNGEETAKILANSSAGSYLYGSYYSGGYGSEYDFGDGKGGSNATASNTKTSKYDPERYHLITRQLKDLQREYDRLNKIKENCYGTNKLEAIQREIDATDQLIKGQKALIREAEDYLKIDAGRLKGLLGAGEFQVDENGNLLNFEALQEKYRKKAEEDKDEHAQDVWKALQQYEETLDKLQEANVEMQDLLYQEMELRLEKITTKAELKIDFDERELKLLDHYIDRIDDNIYHTAEVLALTEQKLGTIAHEIETTREGIAGIFEELSDSEGNKIRKANGSAYTLDEWLALSNEERDLLDINDAFGKQLEEYMDDLLEYIEELEEFKTKGVEEFGEAFDELNDNIRSSIDLFDHYNQLLSSLKNITDLQGVKLTAEMRAARKEIDQIMFQNTQNNIQAEGANYKRLTEEVAQLRTKIANTEDEDLKRAWEEQLKSAEEALRESQQNMLSLWETGLQQAQDMFNQALEDAVIEYESAIAGMYGTVDELEKAWDQQKKNDEFYVKDYKKYYQISKLQRSINKDLDAAARAGNKQNQGLKKLYDELNEARENGVELSEYDLDIYEKRYEYEKALMELEDARNNKSEVRLQRDANGNWGYVYTSAADEDDLIAKQQAVDDKFYELQKATQERVASLSDDLMSEITGVGKRLQELRSSGASQETIDKYLEQEKLYLDNYKKGLAKALEDAGMTEEEARTRYGNAGFDILNDFQETLFSAITGGDEGLDEFFARIGVAINGADSTMAAAGAEYQKQMNAVNKWFNESGEDLSKVIKGFAAIVGEESSGTLLDSEEQIQNAKNTFKDILEVASNFEREFMTIYQPIIDANEQLVEDLFRALKALNGEEYEGPDHNHSSGSDISEIISTAPTISDGSSSGSSSGGNGSGKTITGYTGWQSDSSTHWKYAKYSDGTTGTTKQQEASHTAGDREVFGINNRWRIRCTVCGRILKSGAYGQFLEYDSGGYTGEWGPEGRQALVHEKELILNKDDTKNFLNATTILRTLDLQAGLFGRGLGNIITPWISDLKSEALDQNVHIDATFPNVTDHNEIELAFDNLINKASQYANRKNMSAMTFQDTYTSSI